VHKQHPRGHPGGRARALQETNHQRLTVIIATAALLIGIGLLHTPLVHAQDDNPGTVAELIEAIETANSQPGNDATITLTAPQYVLTKTYDATADSGLPVISTTVTIEGNGAIIRRTSDDHFRLFYVFPEGELTLRNVTVTGGGSDISPRAGGGILNYGRLTIEGSTISENEVQATDAVGGGGIANYAGTLTIRNGHVTSNTLESSVQVAVGGGVLNRHDGTVIIEDTSIAHNTAKGGGGALGGGLANESGSITIRHATVDHNETHRAFVLVAAGETRTDNGYGFSGGGLANQGTLTMTESTVSKNSAEQDGGGVYNLPNGTLALWSSTLRENVCNRDGGGVYNHASAPVQVLNCTISGNGGQSGGGVANLGTITVAHTTISTNTASQRGGGFFESSADTATFQHTIIAGNEASEGAEVALASEASANANSYNLFGHAGLSDAVAFSGFSPGPNDIKATQDGANTSLSSILDPALKDNRGKTWTHALVAGSPAIDAGNPDVESPPPYDQRGVGFTRVSNGLIDIGAYEYQGSQAVGGATVSGTGRGIRVSAAVLLALAAAAGFSLMLASRPRPTSA